jgi:formiminotetrahydrofolate cyclodeaminase
MSRSLADLTVRAFNDQIADPGVFSGGGSVAALAAASAGSLALLVMRLNAKRKVYQEQRPELEAAIDRMSRVVERFYQAADEDIEMLDQLLGAQRHQKATGDSADYISALTAAARSPIQLAELTVELVELIDSQMPLASRFTISDLGAAAVLAEGACRAALLTAEVNIALLRDIEGSDPAVLQELERRRVTAVIRTESLAEDIERRTRSVIHREPVDRERQA